MENSIFCAALFSLFITKTFLSPHTHILSVHLPFAGYTVAQLLLLFYCYLYVVKLIFVCCDFLSFYNVLEKCVSEHSSCYSSETQHLLKCAKKVQSTKKVTYVIQSITKIDFTVSLVGGGTNEQAKKIYVFLGHSLK